MIPGRPSSWRRWAWHSPWQWSERSRLAGAGGPTLVRSGRDPEVRRLIMAAIFLAASIAVFLGFAWIGLFH